jgi:hypothetical protein
LYPVVFSPPAKKTSSPEEVAASAERILFVKATQREDLVVCVLHKHTPS